MPEAREITNVAFADECSFNLSGFRSIAVVSARLDFVGSLRVDVDRLVPGSEFRFRDLREGRMRDAAIALIDHVLPLLGSNLRVDVLVWSTEDSRRKGVVGRDDVADLERMYFHLLEGVTTTKWKDSGRWVVHPDEQSEVDWETMSQILARSRRPTEGGGLIEKRELEGLARLSKLHQLKPLRSVDEPLIQVADLFAGLSVFSWREREKYEAWEAHLSGQGTLMDHPAEPELSTGDINRCRVLGHLLDRCRREKRGIGISSGGLRTRDWSRPLNFWPWEPQSDLDKAPIRKP